LKKLMHAGNNHRPIVIGDELGAGSSLETKLIAFPIGKGQIHLYLLSQLSDSRPSCIVASIESPPNLF
jgi:hypothetical protein